MYKQVCAACHSLNYLCYRNLVGEIMTEAEAKVEAKEVCHLFYLFVCLLDENREMVNIQMK